MSRVFYEILKGLIIDDSLNSNGIATFYLNNASPEGDVSAIPGSLCADTTNGKLYVKNTGVGNTGWIDLASATPPAGSDTQIQYNSGGTAFGASSNLTYSANVLYLNGSIKLGTASIRSIIDANSNEILSFAITVAAAVNEITMSNAATGNAPSISATGDNTDISLSIYGKGAGKVKLGTALLQFPNADGTSNQVLKTDGAGVLSWSNATALVTPAGSNTEVQYNNTGAFGASSNFVYGSTDQILYLTGKISGSSRIVQPPISRLATLEVNGNFYLDYDDQTALIYMDTYFLTPEYFGKFSVYGTIFGDMHILSGRSTDTSSLCMGSEYGARLKIGDSTVADNILHLQHAASADGFKLEVTNAAFDRKISLLFSAGTEVGATTDAAGASIALYNTSHGTLANLFEILNRNAADISIGANNTEVLRIKSGGNVEITGGNLKFATASIRSIADANGNEIISFSTTVAAAINEITFTNAIASASPSISTTGDDTNIDLALFGKGSGNVKIGTALLKFPNADGAADTCIKTDGSGVLGWSQALGIGSTPTFLSLTLTQTTGLALLTISSTTKVSNLNVDKWDDQDYPLTNLGDLFVGDALGVASRLGVGGLNTLLHGGTTPTWSAVVEADISLSNNTTNNVSIAAHGFTPLLPNSSALYLNGIGNWSTPAGTVSSYSLTTFTLQTSVNVIHSFGTYPIVQVLDSSHAVFINYSIIHNTVNDFTITFSSATTGSVLASVGSPQPQAYQVVTADTIATTADRIIKCTASGKTITLFTSVGNVGREIIVDNASSGDIYVACFGAETINGDTTKTLPANTAINLYADGSAWRIY